MKKNQPPPLPQPTLSSKDVFTNTIRPTLDSFTAVNEAIDRIVDKGTKILYNTYLRTKIAKHNSDYLIVGYTEAMTQEVMPYDPGESIDCLISNWTEDEEPEGTMLDSWSVQTARITKPRHPTPTTMNNDSFTSLEGPGSKRNSLTGKFRNSLKRFSMLKGLAGALKPSTKNLDYVSEQVNCLKGEYDVQLEYMPVPKVEEDKVVDQIREEIALRKKIKQKKLDEQAEVRRKQEELKDRIKQFERQSKDNAFTFDYEGNVIYVSKQSNIKKKSISTYNMKNPLETLKRLPSDAPIRSLETEGNDLQKLSLASTKHLTNEKFGLSRTAQFRDAFDVKPGVMLKMPSSVKQGPEYKDENRMKREDFMKILEARKNEKGRPKELNQIAEEEETEEVKRKAESALMSELRKLADMNHDAEIEIYQQEMLIQMLMNTDSRKISELYNIGKAKSRIDLPTEEGAQRKSVLEDRIVEYNKTGMSEVQNPKQKPSTAKTPIKLQVSKVQQGLDSYNRNLIQKETWGQEKPRATPSGLTPLTSPRLSPEKKSAIKTSIFESHVPKDPRDRTTVGQKRAIAQTARASVDPELASPTEGLLSARGESEAKKFIIRSAAKEKIPDDFGFKMKAQATKSGVASKNETAVLKNKANASVSSISKSNQQTPRMRVNV